MSTNGVQMTSLPENLPAKLIVKSNKLIEAAYKLTLQEQRIILTLVSMIHSDDEDFKDYFLDIKDFIKIAGLTGSSAYLEARKITRRLKERVLEIEDLEKNSLLQVSWLSSSLYFHDEGYVRLRFDPALRPFLLGIKSRFTQYALLNAIKLRSIYSIRIYELLKQYELIKERTFILDELKKILGLQKDDYPHFGHFRNRVIDSAVKEINEKTDLYIKYDTEKKRGRKINRIIFYINKTELKKEEQPPILEIKNQKLYDRLIKYFSQTPKQAKEYLNKYPEEQILGNLLHVERRFKEGKINNIGAYTQKAITEDYRDQRSLFEIELQEKNEEKQKEVKRRADLKKLEQLRDDYESFKRKEIEKIKKEIPEEKLKNFEQIAYDQAEKEHGDSIGIKVFTRLNLEKIIAKEYNLPSFEHWRKSLN